MAPKVNRSGDRPSGIGSRHSASVAGGCGGFGPRPDGAGRWLRGGSLAAGTRSARGMTTIEYALGILCAAAIALTLLRIVNDESFFQAMKEWVMGLVASLTKG